jgi:cohesin loading factor subunit SCC2
MILLAIMTSPGIDRRVVKEDAIVACFILMRHNLAKNVLPAINNCGHILAGMSKSQLHASPIPTKKRRRRSSVGAGVGSDVATIKDMGKCYKLMIFQTIGNTVLLMERLDALIQKVPLDDQHLMTCSAGALVSLELDPSTDAAVSLTHQLHIATIGIVTSIFRNYNKLRQMIVEDLFALMLKMPSGKKGMRTYPVQCSSILYPEGAWELSRSLSSGDNSSPSSSSSSKIQPISVAIINLVHASVTRPSFIDPLQNSNVNNTSDVFGKQVDTKQPPRLDSGLRGCQAVSDFFVNHLLMRCSKKGEDGGASEFRPILNNLIEDLLLVLLVPEYPAAEMILLSIANFMYRDIIQMTSLKAVKESTTTTYFNTIFDALGKICSAVARINKWNDDHPVRLELPNIQESNANDSNSTIQHLGCYCGETEFVGDTFMVKCDRCRTWYHGDCIGVSRDTLPEKWLCDGCQFDRIVEFERDRNVNLGELGCPANLIDRMYCLRRLVIDYLSTLTRNSGLKGIQDVYGFQLARWLKTLEIANAKNNYLDENDTLPLIAGLIELWDPQYSPGIYQGTDAGSLNGMLNCLSDEGRSRMVVDFICKLSSLLTSFKSQVGRIVKLLESPSKSVRKLSLKAIEKIADADPNLMTNSFIRNAVARRFSDESISVRDAVVSLVGSYVMNTPDIANAFHPALIHGLTDSGLSVRKRTVHVFRDILSTNPSYNGRAEACSGMLRLAADPKEDDTVRDLIYDLFSTIWLENGEKISDGQRRSSQTISAFEDLISPVSKASNLEDMMLATTPSKTSSRVNLIPATPTRWSSVTKSTRSTARKSRSRYHQLRCQAAAHQMVEVVKAANTEYHLTLLFRELLSDTPDSDKSKKSSARKKRNGHAKAHVSMLVDALFEMLLGVEEDNDKSTVEKGGELVSIFRTLRVFTDASPIDVLRHLDTLLPYLKIDNGLRPTDEANIACSLCGVLSRVIPELDHDDCERLAETSLADDLVGITKKWGKAASSSAVQALCLFSAKEQPGHLEVFGKRLLALAKIFFAYLVKTEKSGDYTTKRKTKSHVSRALSVLGAICQYCESSSFDLMEIGDHDDEANVQELSLLTIAPACERIFMKFYAKDDVMTKVSAIQALTGVFMAHPREMLDLENSGLITEVMASTSPEPVQRESLRCWRDILLAEESRVESGEAKARMDSKKNITVSKKISGDQDADATLFGGILTNHASRLFEMTKSREKSIRFAAVDLIGHLLRQGQLNPNEATPHLLALQGDVEESIRGNALKFLMLEGEKRPDMLRQRLCAGVKQAYLFQAFVYPDLEEVSALITVRKDGSLQKECVFGSVYKNCIARNKKQRRGLFRNLLSVFDPQNLKNSEAKKIDSSMASLMLLSYTSQVLAYLPYNVASDPLYTIYYISSNIALQGADLLDNFAAFLRPYGLASADELDEVNAEEDELEKAAKSHFPHPAKNVAAFSKPKSLFDNLGFSKLCSEAGCLILLLRLKTFLRETYNLSEARCIGFNPDKKEIGEKPILKSPTSSIFDSKLPTYSKSGNGKRDDLLDAMILQYAEFRRLMRSEVNNAYLLDDESIIENEDVSEEEMVNPKRLRSNSEGEEL